MDAVVEHFGIAFMVVLVLWAIVVALSPGGMQRYEDERRRRRRRR
jgi:hypothetical protein